MLITSLRGGHNQFLSNECKKLIYFRHWKYPVFQVTLLQMSSYPDININRELCNYSSTSHEDNRTVLIQVYEPLFKQLTRTFIENGFVAALEKAAHLETDSHPVVVSFAKYALRVVNMWNSVQYYYHPYRRDHGVYSISKFTQTREWPRSFIRVIRWHPNVFKLAIAACDDSIRIYTDEKTMAPVLKVCFGRLLVTNCFFMSSNCRTFFKNA